MIAAYLDSVHCTDRNPGYRYTREDVASNLEHSHRKSVSEDGQGRVSKFREADGGRHEEETVECNEAELDKCKGDWITKLIEDGLPCIG